MLLYLLLSALIALSLGEFLSILTRKKAGIKKAKKLICSKDFHSVVLNMPKDIENLFELIEKSGFKKPKYCVSSDIEQKKICYALSDSTEDNSKIYKSEIDIEFKAYTKSKYRYLFMKKTLYNIEFLYSDNDCTQTCVLFKCEIKSSVNEMFQPRNTKKY